MKITKEILQQTSVYGDPEASNQTQFLRQLSRFIVIGLLSVAADFLVYRLLLGYGLPFYLSKGLSYVSGMLVGFCGNKLWTFESKSKSLREPLAFSGLYLTTLLLNVIANELVLQLFGRSWIYPAYLAATSLSTTLNFLGLRFWIFRTKPTESSKCNHPELEIPKYREAA